MSLTEGEITRYQQMLDVLRDQLLPAFKAACLPSEALLFARGAIPAEAQAVLAAHPDGSETDLANAIQQAVAGASPAAVIALTDGASNHNAGNSRALAALLDAQIPFIGIGFGSDQGASTLNVRRLDSSAVVPPKQNFTIGVQIEATTTQVVPPFDLSLFRDGKLIQTRKIASFPNSRFWLETFTLKEEEEGAHQYLAQLDLPPGSGFVIANRTVSSNVRVSAEKEFRVLFAQGALTWDFKFIARALQDDPTVKLTGLSRTSEHSIFRQNVEAAGELLNGFPEKLEEIAPFRVVVLSDLQPADFNPAQQETLARFCRELGGGVLLIGGAGTFGPEWRDTTLEQLLPVKFDPNRGVAGLDQPFHLEMTAEALRHAAFQIAPPNENAAAWEKIPAFTQYGRVLEAKAGATVLGVHGQDVGPQGKRILMASQRYGAGQSAVICVQNFWRWRLAKDSDPELFDRFWRQFVRWLGETSRQPFEISFPAQDLKVESEIQFIVERQPEAPVAPGSAQPEIASETSVEVIDPAGHTIFQQKVNPVAGQPESLHFHAQKEGLYRVRVVGSLDHELASRSLEIKNLNVEFQQTARDMENLRQWAEMTKGIAVKAEECQHSEVIQEILNRVQTAREARRERIPLGLNWAMQLLVLGSLSAEWMLRRKWSLR